jgi:hypothetical protein
LVIAGTVGAAVAGAGAWLAGPPGALQRFGSSDDALRWIDTLAADRTARSLTDWPLPQVLEHAAQSVEYSVDGYPQPRPGWYQATAGSVAFAVFDRQGRRRHSLTEPIPGAPALAASAIEQPAARLAMALRRFESHTGALAPHFAFGALDKAAFRRAHLMHLANHAERIEGGH